MAGKRKAKTEEKPRRRRTHDAISDWGGIDGDTIRTLIESVTKDGGAIRFGYTRDGGAYSIGIYGDGSPYTEFCPATNDVEEWLEGFIHDFG